MLRLTHSENYPIILPPEHRFPIQKYELVRVQLEYEGIIQSSQSIPAEFVDEETILLTHCPTYWEDAKNLALEDRHYRKIGFPKSPALVKRSWSSASGTVRSALHALEDGAGMNLAGGTHHAFFDRGEGFCLLNDIAVAANYLLDKGLIKKALVIDLDVHQGNGTASLFEKNPNVFTLSIHCEKNYPFKKERSDLDIDVPAGADDVTYLDLLQSRIPALIESFQPDLVFYQAGVDVLQQDRLGKLSLTLQGCYERDKWVISQTRKAGLPLVVVMGGGYSYQMKTLVNAHCNTFKIAIEEYEKGLHFIA